MSFRVEEAKKIIFNSFVRKTQKVVPIYVLGDAKKFHGRVSLKSTGPGKFLELTILVGLAKKILKLQTKKQNFSVS
jgi:hypothetical protein